MKNGKQLRFGTRWTKDHFDGEVAFKNMRAEFEEAAAKHPEELCESLYLFGGQSVRVRMVGRELAEHIARPFSLLRICQQNSTAPQLSIDLWDENKANAIENIFSRETLEWTETTVKSPDDRFVGQQLPHTHSCLVREARHLMAAIV